MPISLKPFYSIFSDTNKVKEGEQNEEQSTLVPELELSMKPQDLLDLATIWRDEWNKYKGDIDKKQDENERYWKGQHFTNAEMETGRAMTDNLIFEAMETALPIATKKNPEPVVSSSNVELAKNVKKFLVKKADDDCLKMQIKMMARYHQLDLLGVGKFSWNMQTDSSQFDVFRVKKRLILDPDGYLDAKGRYRGQYIGEYKKQRVSDLIVRFKEKAEYFQKKYEGKLGTKARYIEWWTPEYVFYTDVDLKEVFGKSKNPHWNYDHEETKTVTDEYGEETEEITSITGNNHFEAPEMPYIFLGIYTLGDQPFDATSLIGQNLANQDMINKRNKQIDKNIDRMNGGRVISGENSGLTKEEAALATKALDKGGAVFIPNGTPTDAVANLPGTPLPSDVFRNLEDKRETLRNIFGVRGSSPSGTVAEQTATGKQIVRSQDDDRIGGGISEYLEQIADKYFNWQVQMMYVYYDEEKIVNIVGKDDQVEGVSIKNTDFDATITISVKEGSMIPHDDVAEAQTVADLGKSGLIDPITMFDKLGFPNPKELAKKLWLWKNAPEMLFEDDPVIKGIIEQKAAAEAAAVGAIPPKQ